MKAIIISMISICVGFISSSVQAHEISGQWTQEHFQESFLGEGLSCVTAEKIPFQIRVAKDALSYAIEGLSQEYFGAIADVSEIFRADPREQSADSSTHPWIFLKLEKTYSIPQERGKGILRIISRESYRDQVVFQFPLDQEHPSGSIQHQGWGAQKKSTGGWRLLDETTFTCSVD